MHQQIKELCQIIVTIDNDPVKSMSYFTGVCDTKTPLTKPLYNCRWLLITDALHRLQHQFMHSDDCSYVDSHVDELFNKLNDVYQRNQHHCWQSHHHHFHRTFEEYVNCPITCLAEVSEYLSKIIKELYTT
jgi:hypothetical protein